MKELGDKEFVLREIAGVRTSGNERELPEVSRCQTLVQMQVQSPNRSLCMQLESLAMLGASILCPNCDSLRDWQVKIGSAKGFESKSHGRGDVPAKEFCLISSR
jgi:hypothetical protein